MSELKACPFCGAFPLHAIDRRHYEEKKYWVHKINCSHGECLASIGPAENYKRLVKMWNRRVSDE